MGEPRAGLLVSDFNIQNLANLLTHGSGELRLCVNSAPLGQVVQTLTQASASPQVRKHFAVVWTQPQAVLEEVHRALEGAPVDYPRLQQQVDTYCDAVLRATDWCEIVLVATWALPAMQQGLSPANLGARGTVPQTLLRANLRLFERLEAHRQIFVVDAARWIELAGHAASSPRLWYLGKIPFSNEVFAAAAKEIKALLAAIWGHSRKLLVLDLDDTLWGGVVGDVGWQNITLGGHDPEGEALVDFQRGLKTLSQQGIALAIVSKNDEETALAAIDNHPEMLLRRDDFAGWKINWQDKANNILQLTTQLNLGLQSVVFIDDNPAERNRVRFALPDVLVPEWPPDKRLYPQALRALDCFVKSSVTDEDRRRSQMYVQERRREEQRQILGSVEEWLATLDICVTVNPLDAASLPRAAQLLNKTNQMNLATRRLTEADFQSWTAEDGHRGWVYRVSDKFGDSGLCGLLTTRREGDRVTIVDFVLSCRAMGRNIEEAMIAPVTAWASSTGATGVVAVYEATPRNKPCLDFFLRSGFVRRNETEFEWDCRSEYPEQSHIKIVTPQEA